MQTINKMGRLSCCLMIFRLLRSLAVLACQQGAHAGAMRAGDARGDDKAAFTPEHFGHLGSHCDEVW